MKRRHFIALTLTVFLLMPLIRSAAAVIKFKSGEELKGIILKKDKNTIEVIAQGETKIYKLEDIESIRGNKPHFGNVVKANDNPTFENVLSCASSGNFLKAKEILEIILKNDPSNINAKESLNIIKNMEEGKINKDYTTYLFKGAHCMVNQRYEDAVTAFMKALEIDKRPEIYYDIACAYQAMEKHSEAVPYFKKVIEKQPEDADANFRLGLALYTLEQYNESIPYLEKFISLAPDYAESYTFAGMSYYLTGQKAKAKEYIEKAKNRFLKEGNNEDAEEMSNLLKQLEF